MNLQIRSMFFRSYIHQDAYNCDLKKYLIPSHRNTNANIYFILLLKYTLHTKDDTRIFIIIEKYWQKQCARRAFQLAVNNIFSFPAFQGLHFQWSLYFFPCRPLEVYLFGQKIQCLRNFTRITSLLNNILFFVVNF